MSKYITSRFGCSKKLPSQHHCICLNCHMSAEVTYENRIARAVLSSCTYGRTDGIVIKVELQKKSFNHIFPFSWPMHVLLHEDHVS